MPHALLVLERAARLDPLPRLGGDLLPALVRDLGIEHQDEFVFGVRAWPANAAAGRIAGGAACRRGVTWLDAALTGRSAGAVRRGSLALATGASRRLGRARPSACRASGAPPCRPTSASRPRGSAAGRARPLPPRRARRGPRGDLERPDRGRASAGARDPSARKAASPAPPPAARRPRPRTATSRRAAPGASPSPAPAPAAGSSARATGPPPRPPSPPAPAPAAHPGRVRLRALTEQDPRWTQDPTPPRSRRSGRHRRAGARRRRRRSWCCARRRARPSAGTYRAAQCHPALGAGRADAVVRAELRATTLERPTARASGLGGEPRAGARTHQRGRWGAWTLAAPAARRSRASLPASARPPAAGHVPSSLLAPPAAPAGDRSASTAHAAPHRWSGSGASARRARLSLLAHAAAAAGRDARVHHAPHRPRAPRLA